MGSLPAVFPDGRPLQAKADPWLLSDLVRSHVSRLMSDRPFLSYLQKWISIVLAWWVVPFTLILFWGRYLRRHDLIGTTLHCVLTAICITAAIFMYLLAAATLRGDSRRRFVWTAALLQLRAWRPAVVVLLSGIALVSVSLGAIDGVRLGVAGRDWWPAAEVAPIPGFYPQRSVPAAMEKIGYAPFADLRGANLTASAESPAEKSGVKKTDKSDAQKDDVEDDDAEKTDVAKKEAAKDDTASDSARVCNSAESICALPTCAGAVCREQS